MRQPPQILRRASPTSKARSMLRLWSDDCAFACLICGRVDCSTPDDLLPRSSPGPSALIASKVSSSLLLRCIRGVLRLQWHDIWASRPSPMPSSTASNTTPTLAPKTRGSAAHRLTSQPQGWQTTTDQRLSPPLPASIGIDGRLRSESGGRDQSECSADFSGIRTLARGPKNVSKT